MVKVIWHKAASPQQTNGSIVFARCHQCALPWGHIGATWRIRLNLCFLWPTSPQLKQQIDRFSRFCTAHGRKSLYFATGAPFPQNCPFPWGSGPPIRYLIYDSLGQSEPTTQTASRSVQPFLLRWPQCPYTSQWDAPSPPSKLPLPMGDMDPHLLHGSLGPPESSTQTASRSVQPFLQGSLVWQTDRPR